MRTIAIGAAAASLGYVGLVLAPTWEWVLASLCVEYISGSLVAPSFGAFIAEQSTEEVRGRVFGISQGIFMVVGAIGPALGGYLAFHYGFRLMFVVGAILYITATVVRIWMARSVRFTGDSQPEPLTLKSLGNSLRAMLSMVTAGGIITWVLVTDGVRDIAYRLSGELEPVYFSEIGGLTVEEIGWLGSLFGITMMLTMLPAGWLADNIGERAAIITGFATQFLGFVVFLTAMNFMGFAISTVIFGLGVGVMGPAYDSLVSKAVPEKMRGIAFGLFQTSLGVISLPAPFLGALLWESATPRTPFFLTAMALLISVLPVWLKFKLPARNATVEEEAPA